MEFDYVVEGSIFVSEDELNYMAEQVKGGRAQRAAFGQTGAHLSIDNLYNFLGRIL